MLAINEPEIELKISIIGLFRSRPAQMFYYRIVHITVV